MSKTTFTASFGYKRLKMPMSFNKKNMDERTSHDEDEFQDTEEDELEDIDEDEDDSTPADTDDSDEESDDEPKTPAEKARAAQRKKWLTDIREGKKSLDDMPENLGWLRKDLESNELKQSKQDEDDIDSKVEAALLRKQQKEEVNLLLDDIEETASNEQLAVFQKEYESLKEEGISKYRAVVIARKLAGLEDAATVLAKRRRKSRILPPSGERPRNTVHETDKMTDIEKRLSGGLPKGFQ